MAKKEMSRKKMKQTKGGAAPTDDIRGLRLGQQPASTLVREPAAAEPSAASVDAARLKR
jgi:hypothetical protein